MTVLSFAVVCLHEQKTGVLENVGEAKWKFWAEYRFLPFVSIALREIFCVMSKNWTEQNLNPIFKKGT